MNTCQEQWIEENRDGLEKRYYEMYEMTLGDCLDGCKEAFMMFEDALVRMGILEPDQMIDPDDLEDDPFDEDRMAYER